MERRGFGRLVFCATLSLLACSRSAIPDVAPANGIGGSVLQSALQGTIALSIDAVCTGTDKTVHDDGTGFLVDENGTFLTAAHIIPACDSYKTLLIEGELRPPLVTKKGPTKLRLSFIDRSSAYDVALLGLQGSAPNPIVGKALPLSPSSLDSSNIGDSVAIVGYPIQESSRAYPSTLSGSGADGTLEANQIVERGFSGAPVLTSDGRVVGMIRGGRTVQEVTNAAVLGWAQFVPMAKVLPALKRETVSQWSQVPVSPQAAPQAPILISRSIDVTREVHELSETEGSYPPLAVDALPGYKITNAEFHSFSETRSQRTIDIAGDGSRVEMRFSLRSGPIYDQYRGWIKGTLVVTMVPRPAPTTPTPGGVPKTITQHIDATREVHEASASEEQYPPVEIDAPPGYRIVSAEFHSQSETGCKRQIDISPDKTRAVLTYRLESGPFYDQYRGWIHGDFVVKLEARFD